MITVEEIRALAHAENAANEARELFDDEGNPAPPEPGYWEALEAWLQGYDPRVLPFAHRAMRELDQAYGNFNASGDAEPNEFFWRLRDDAQRACATDPPPRKERKTPTALNADKVPLRQIAYEWRWLKEGGQPDIDRVQREIDKPGSELTPEAIEARHQFDLSQAGFIAPEEVEEWRPESIEEHSEPIEDMIFARASVEQIATLKATEHGGTFEGWSAIVEAMAAEMDVELPLNAREMVNESGHDLARAQLGKEMAEAPIPTRPSMPENEILIEDDEPEIKAPAETVDEQIVELFQAGNDLSAIARELRVSKTKVKKTIATWEESLQGAEQ